MVVEVGVVVERGVVVVVLYVVGYCVRREQKCWSCGCSFYVMCVLETKSLGMLAIWVVASANVGHVGGCVCLEDRYSSCVVMWVAVSPKVAMWSAEKNQRPDICSKWP